MTLETIIEQAKEAKRLGREIEKRLAEKERRAMNNIPPDDIETMRRHNREVATRNEAITAGADSALVHELLAQLNKLRDEVEKLTVRVGELENDVNRLYREK